jgi:hypothetical protein
VSPPITGEYWAEGPSALKIDDYVYVITVPLKSKEVL